MQASSITTGPAAAAAHQHHQRPFTSAAPSPRPRSSSIASARSATPLMVVTQQQQQLLRASPAASLASLAAAPHRAAAAGSRARRSLIVRAGWGDPVDFKPAKLVSNARVAEQLHKVVVDVGAEIAAGYSVPGQFVQIKVGEEGKPGFFAISSPPDPNNQGLLEFLIKANGAAAEAIAALGAGAEVAVSPVQGKGFPVDKIPAADHPTVLMFATGSGISPIKALIESGQLGERPNLRLYYGTRDAAHTAYADRIPAWEAAGVKVIQVFSEASTGASGRYVQDAFNAAKDLGAGAAGVGAVLCGHKGMCEAVKESLAAEGVDVGAKVLLNF